MLKLKAVLLFSMTMVQIVVSDTDCPGCGLKPVTFGYGARPVQELLQELSEVPGAPGAIGPIDTGTSTIKSIDTSSNNSASNKTTPKISRVLSPAARNRTKINEEEVDTPAEQLEPGRHSAKQSEPKQKTHSEPHPHLEPISPATNDTTQELRGGMHGGGCNNCNTCVSCKKCKKNVCDVPIVPEICSRQFTACNDDIHFHADINLMFKDKGFWCKLKHLVKQAVEEGLDDRCELCRYNYVEKYI